jgi:sugar phosphate isomerase/epimerase
MSRPLGRGDLDYPAVLSALENAGFPGFIILRSCMADDPMTEIRQARDFLFRL